jgi:electron transport complex protein RnfC
LYWHARADNFRAAQDQHLFDCIECGLCAYVCPSHIPLVQYYRYAKTRVADAERRERGAEFALARFLARNARAEQKHVAPVPPAPDPEQALAEKRAYIEAAVERSRRRKEHRDREPDNDG